MSPPAVWLRGERRLAAQSEVWRSAFGRIRRIERGEREVEGLRIEPLDRDVEIALERALDRVIERQLDARSRRRGGMVGRVCSFVSVLPANAGFVELLSRFPGDLRQREPILTSSERALATFP